MNKQDHSFSTESKQQETILQHTSFNTSINGTVYLLESRILQLDGANQRSEYRVWRDQAVIKDWTEGDVEKYFGSDLYQESR